MFTADKYQQIGFSAEQKGFALRYQTAGMLKTVLREGVLGEDDAAEESPKLMNLAGNSSVLPQNKFLIRSPLHLLLPTLQCTPRPQRGILTFTVTAHKHQLPFSQIWVQRT